MQTDRLKLLLVEDDEEDYMLIRLFLSQAWKEAFDLVWAGTFEEGVRQFERDNFSVILVDYRLGARTGLEFIQEVKTRNHLVPTILLTGHGNMDIDLQVMQAGAAGYLSKGELNAQQLERTIRYAIERMRTEQKLLEEIEALALTDTLTGIYNRRGFEKFGKQELERFRRYRHPLSAILMDIDNFKSVNDRYGHAFGDEVLKALTSSCTDNIREMDVACRHGGDEFVILLPETNLQTARAVADRIRACFAGRTFRANGKRFHLTASFGVAAAREETTSLDALLEDADTAMYKSKLKGRNRVETE